MNDALSSADHLAIQALLYGYAWALDTGDVDAFVDLFSTDGVLVWDAFEAPEEWRGHAALRAFAEDLRDLPSTAGRQHHVANVLATGGQGTARVKAYVTVHLRQPEAPHPTTVMGWYDDECVLENGQWKIRRHVIRDWCGPVLRRLAGQSGEREARARPPMLARLGRRE
ncbi:MAG TPA: nuclear transport factor 2 family protein [Pseudomonadaceae bacterium]|nr:nuclear transport factor 2 family protein [Pseudomonadaceae bacterium]